MCIPTYITRPTPNPVQHVGPEEIQLIRWRWPYCSLSVNHSAFVFYLHTTLMFSSYPLVMEHKPTKIWPEQHHRHHVHSMNTTSTTASFGSIRDKSSQMSVNSPPFAPIPPRNVCVHNKWNTVHITTCLGNTQCTVSLVV